MESKWFAEKTYLVKLQSIPPMMIITVKRAIMMRKFVD